MVDFILFCFVAGCFATGFWCGKTFGTVKAMVKRGMDAVGDWF